MSEVLTTVGEVEHIHFTNIAALTRQANHSRHRGQPYLITEQAIRTFASLTHNHQWIHEDSVRATQESPYGAIIAHGLFILTLIPALLPQEQFVVIGHRVRIVRGIDRVRIPAPAYPGDLLTAHSRIQSVYPALSGKGTVIARDVECWTDKSDRPVLSCILSLQYF